MEGILGPLIYGIVIAALARLVLPGKQGVPWWVHLLVGVVGAYVGYWLAAALGVAETGGAVDWLRLFISVIVAVGALVVVDRMGVGADT